MSNKLVSFDGGKKKEEQPLLSFVKITYNNGESEILKSDSWGTAGEIENYLVFFRTVDKDESLLIGFRNQLFIKKIDMVDEFGVAI